MTHTHAYTHTYGLVNTTEPALPNGHVYCLAAGCVCVCTCMCTTSRG